MQFKGRKIVCGLAPVLACAATVTTVLAFATPVAAQDSDEMDYVSTNLFGGVGLLRTPTARFAPDGQFEIGASFLNPYRNYYLNWQILPWAEVVFRYADITNRPGQISAIPQSTGKFFEDLIKFRNANTFLDRSFDFRFRLLKEGKYAPALALGFQDAIGTAFEDELARQVEDPAAHGSGSLRSLIGLADEFASPCRGAGCRTRQRWDEQQGCEPSPNRRSHGPPRGRALYTPSNVRRSARPPLIPIR